MLYNICIYMHVYLYIPKNEQTHKTNISVVKINAITMNNSNERILCIWLFTLAIKENFNYIINSLKVICVSFCI